METLCARLTTIFNRPTEVGSTKLVDEVTAVLAEYCASGTDDWRRFCFWNDIHYTRNLVIECDQFELIVLCWNKNQGSRIHNHASSDCWLGVLSGHLTETNYIPLCEKGEAKCEAKHPTPVDGPCPTMRRGDVLELLPGQVGYASDRLTLHTVRTQTDVQSVSLHVYAPPIRQVKIYEPEHNQVLARKPGFYSRAGMKA